MRLKHLKPGISAQDLVDHATVVQEGYFVSCDRCHGVGSNTVRITRFGREFDRLEPCSKCDGDGRIWISVARRRTMREVVLRNTFKVFVIAVVIIAVVVLLVK